MMTLFRPMEIVVMPDVTYIRIDHIRRLASTHSTIEPGEAGTSTVTFECRYPSCAKSRVMVIGKPRLGQDVLSA